MLILSKQNKIIHSKSSHTNSGHLFKEHLKTLLSMQFGSRRIPNAKIRSALLKLHHWKKWLILSFLWQTKQFQQMRSQFSCGAKNLATELIVAHNMVNGTTKAAINTLCILPELPTTITSLMNSRSHEALYLDE